MVQPLNGTIGISGETDGYRAGGFGDDRIEKFPFSAPFTTSINVGTLGIGSASGGFAWSSV